MTKQQNEVKSRRPEFSGTWGIWRKQTVTAAEQARGLTARHGVKVRAGLIPMHRCQLQKCELLWFLMAA